MRFLIIRRADANTEAGLLPGEALLTDMMQYNESLVNAGVLLAAEGLHPSSKGALVQFEAGKPRVIDGPFSETKELIAGFTMIQARSKDEALEWCKRWPGADAGGNVVLELRQVFEAADFGDAATPALRDQEERLRSRVSTQP